MKFVKPQSYNKWAPEQTKEKIEYVMGEIRALNQELNGADSRINELNEKKKSISRKISNKFRYVNQLKSQLHEFNENEEWKEL